MERKRLRIAFLHLGFFYSGGGEKLVLEEIQGLKALGHEVVCYAPFVDRTSCFPDLMAKADIRPILPQPPSWLPLRDALWILLSCLLIPFMAWRFRCYDIFLGANQPAPWFAWVLGKILSKPYIIYLAQPNRLLYPRQIDLEQKLRIREGDYLFLVALRRIAGWFIAWADQVSVRDAQAMLTNGDYAAGLIRAVYRRNNQLCPAGCHPLPEEALDYAARWQGELSVNGITICKPYVLLTNRHTPQKRFEYVIWALRTVVEKTPHLSLVITGQETQYTKQLHDLIRHLALEEQVQFVGLTSETDLARLYREAALYVYPSPEEDFGMGIIEAMAAGTPVVAWNHGGPTVTVEDGVTGFLAKPWLVSDYTSKMAHLATDPALAERMGRAGHKRAKEKFSYESHHRILEEALGEAVKNYGNRL
ncbi:MAG: glycosyltransferase family 4 protein [Chloroflexi bacterium]|nr:glycosyltransferase family 4 protein [Chloroflexota bacterium]